MNLKGYLSSFAPLIPILVRRLRGGKANKV